MQVEYIDREDETADAVAFTEKALSAAGKQIAKNLNAQKEFNKEMTETEKLTESIKQSIESNVAGAIEAAIFEAQSLNESLSNILRQVASLLIQFGTKSLFNALPFANGGVFAQNGVVPFARGGVVSKPTLFPFANGVGLMGEAGPEAIMPLRRGPSGRLGVEASGGVGNVVVNVDASGSAVQGDQPNAKALGSAIGAAVQAEIIKQKRPGGLLS
jgi:phage-related minor tail protein